MDTEFHVDCGLGHILLNRPKVLNALSPAQYADLDRRLAEWQEDDSVKAIVLEGAGDRAFCAGGDVRAIYDSWKRGDPEANRGIFRTEYRLDRRIHHYPKPVVSLLDGIVMGGGAGLSVNGSFRVATERSRFAMPETGIGFFPDVGATHFLGRCPGRTGLYLGLTGARLGPADMVWSGLATHFVALDDVDALKLALGRAAVSAEPEAAIEQALASFHRDPGPGPLAARQAEVERCFAGDSVANIVTALRAERSAWAWDTLEELAAKSPFSLAVTFRQLTEGRGLSFDDAIRREFRLACRFLAGHDLYEGIRAQVVDKDRTPKWVPENLAAVGDLAVDACFAPLGAEELPLP
jgi:enoyl-CoA hydratase